VSAHEILVTLLGGSCSICGSTENLELHHIDNNRENNDLSNIQLLCRNCHRSQMHGLGGPTEKFMMSVPDAMFEALEAERKRRMLDSIQETLRQIVSEHFRT